MTSIKAKIINLENRPVGELDLAPEVFGVKVRADLLARAIQWQRDKRRAGTHKVKQIGEIRGTTRKPYSQKGTGNARQGSLRSPQFRTGAVIFGPVVRSHATRLNKKVRAQALCCALSSKREEGKLVVLDAAKADAIKTKAAAAALNRIAGRASVLIIDGANPDENFAKSVRNLRAVDLLPEQGANVYDIMRREVLVLTRNAVEQLSGRLKEAV